MFVYEVWCSPSVGKGGIKKKTSYRNSRKMAKKRVKKGKHIISKVWIDDHNSFSSMRFFFNAPSKSSQSGRAKISLNFIEFHWISLHFWWHFTKIWPARSRLYQRIFEFSLRVRRESALISQFLKEKHQTSKEKREKNCNESHDFLMRLLIVKVNKLVWIITRRNRHVPAGDFALH